MTSRRYLGPLDAADDERFREHFVRPDELRALISSDSHIVYGAKGGGKTALRRALTEIENAAFYSTSTIDLDTLNFQRVHVELAKVCEATGADVMSLARATWRNVIVLFFLEVVGDRLTGHADLRERIEDTLTGERFSGADPLSGVFWQVKSFFKRLGNVGLDDAGYDADDVLEARRITVDRFPPTPQLGRLLEDVCGVVAKSGKVVAICIDGFDSIVDHEAESRRAIFAGLIDAIYRISRDAALSKALCVKAFLPKELTHEARTVVWDADKYIYNTVHLHWDDESLKELIAKRLVPHLGSSRKTDFTSIWHEFMPSTVHNVVHNIDEPSFAYILRHTQYRPRQVLFQVQTILNRWDDRSNRFRVDSSFIPSAVAAGNRELAERVVNQLEYARPGMVTFIRSFGGATSTITYDECFSKIGRMFATESPLKTREVFDELFDFGVLGVARRESVAQGRSTAKVRFSYAGEGVTPVHPSDDDVIAVCPMFHDFCGCTPSLYGAVVPSPV